MDATDIAFYSAVATIIPVFLIAYLVVVQKTLDVFGEGSSDSTQQYLQRVRDLAEKKDGKVRSIGGAMGALTLSLGYQLGSLILFVVAVGMPAAADYASLHGLYVGHATSSSKTISLVGTLIAGTIVVAPLVVRVLKIYNPFAISIGLLPLFIDQLRKTSASEGEHDPDRGSEATDEKG